MKNKSSNTIDEYIAGFPREVQVSLRKIQTLIRQATPEATEAIKYGIPTFIQGENLVHFAAYPRHIGFYPTPGTILAFRTELKGYVSAKGSVQFPLDAPIPYKLIERMVAYRVKEVRAKQAAKQRKPK